VAADIVELVRVFHHRLGHRFSRHVELSRLADRRAHPAIARPAGRGKGQGPRPRLRETGLQQSEGREGPSNAPRATRGVALVPGLPCPGSRNGSRMSWPGQLNAGDNWRRSKMATAAPQHTGQPTRAIDRRLGPVGKSRTLHRAAPAAPPAPTRRNARPGLPGRAGLGSRRPGPPRARDRPPRAQADPWRPWQGW